MEAIKKGIRISTSIFSLCLLLAPETIKMLAIYAIIGIVLSGMAITLHKKLKWTQYIHRDLFSLDLMIAMMLAYDFYTRWLPSSKIALITSLLHLSVSAFLTIIAIILCGFALSVIDIILWSVKRAYKNIIKEKNQARVNRYLIILFVIMMQYVSLQYSAISSLSSIVGQRIWIFLLNVLIIVTINLIVVLVVQSWKISLSITSILFCVWSVANYYVILFHGSPLYISELNNTKTAFAVASTYTYNVSLPVILTIVFLLVEMKYIYTDLKILPTYSFKRIILARIVGVVTCVGIVCIAMSNLGSATNNWSWRYAISRYGFGVCVLSDVKSSAEPIIEPEGYEAEKVEAFFENQTTDNMSDNRPDIIVILNETFYDLRYVTTITADVDYMEAFYSIPNAVYGYVITPNIGGGTNNSEFELLYSNSMYLLAGSAPFTYLDNEVLSRSAVRYLNELGYTTTAIHCGAEQNYMRHIAYPAMGFDNIYLGEEAFSHITSNGNRMWLDLDNYQDLMDYYETVDGTPQFIYLLTYQNHGGYEQNDSSMDTVHVTEDFGDLTDDVNEYLSSIKLSAEAFAALTEYYSTIDREVIICMVGDHAPSFISNLPQNQNIEIEDNSINQRAVPYVIWSNFDVDHSKYYEYASMVDLMPMVLDATNIPLSTYYHHILDLHEVLPIRTSDGKGVNRELEVSQYSIEHEYYDLWSSYYYLEYNSLLQGEEYYEELFLP